MRKRIVEREGTPILEKLNSEQMEGAIKDKMIGNATENSDGYLLSIGKDEQKPFSCKWLLCNLAEKTIIRSLHIYAKL